MAGQLQIRLEPPWLVVRFASPQRMASWSPSRPGLVDAQTVAWLEVRDSDLSEGGDAAAWFVEQLAGRGLGDAVGMMTARNVATFECTTVRVGDVEATCVVTLGLNNGERIGSRFDAGYADGSAAFRAGTINILCHVSRPLTDAALLEASSIAAQGRTVALCDARHQRPGLSGPVTGTGTDCIVMAAPAGPDPAAFAGMHTDIGEAVGASVLEATGAALAAWLAARAQA